MGKINEIEVARRKQELRDKLNNLGVYRTIDGKSLQNARYQSLELTHIEVMNEVAKAYGEQ